MSWETLSDRIIADMLKEARSNISLAFRWSETEEGYEYWRDVCDRLEQREIAARARMRQAPVPR